MPQPRSSAVVAAGFMRSREASSARVPMSIRVPAKAAPCAQTVARGRGGPGGAGRTTARAAARRATSTRDFCRASVAETSVKESRRTSFIAWVMCLTRPPTSTVTSGAASAAIASAISRSASSAFGAWTSTTRAPAAAPAASGTERNVPVSPVRSALRASASSPTSRSWTTRTSAAPCSATAPRVRAP